MGHFDDTSAKSTRKRTHRIFESARSEAGNLIGGPGYYFRIIPQEAATNGKSCWKRGVRSRSPQEGSELASDSYQTHEVSGAAASDGCAGDDANDVAILNQIFLTQSLFGDSREFVDVLDGIHALGIDAPEKA